jgi:hypothetical protein
VDTSRACSCPRRAESAGRRRVRRWRRSIQHSHRVDGVGPVSEATLILQFKALRRCGAQVWVLTGAWKVRFQRSAPDGTMDHGSSGRLVSGSRIKRPLNPQRLWRTQTSPVPWWAGTRPGRTLACSSHAPRNGSGRPSTGWCSKMWYFTRG